MAFPTNPVEKQTFNGYIYSNGLWKNFEKSGSIVQVVQYIRPGAASGLSLLQTNTSTWQDIMSVSITPKAKDSRFLVEVVFTSYAEGGASNARTRIVRDSTQIDFIRYASMYNLNGQFQTTTYNIIDSPNTLNTLIYKAQASWSSGVISHFGYGDSGGSEHCSITVSEILA